MKIIRYPISVFLIAIVLTSCTDTKMSNYTSQSQVEITTNNTSIAHPGKKLMETNCYVCHSPAAGHDGRTAPPMVAVKSHYLNDDTTKEEFVNSIWAFVEKPSKYKTKMRGAVNRFGVMPYQVFKEEEVRQIADYIYDNKIDEPEWFKEHVEGKMKYRNKGKK